MGLSWWSLLRKESTPRSWSRGVGKTKVGGSSRTNVTTATVGLETRMTMVTGQDVLKIDGETKEDDRTDGMGVMVEATVGEAGIGMITDMTNGIESISQYYLYIL